MAKTNISFNNKNYQIDDASLSTASAALRQHLSTVMNGTGATINLGGTAYGIDSTKLSAATNDFITHLGKIAGSGHKVMINGVEYSIDSAKVAGAISELEAAFGGDIGEERLEGDGAEYYTLAPTALSFRSTAPLNELQEVQINGVTVDPSNYTLEEGSTIVTFPIEYLKTLNVGNYDVDVVSDSKTVKGGFTVAAPELNEHGFYYNQPYTAYVAAFGENESVFIRDDGTMDIIGTPSEQISPATYTCDGSTIYIVSPIAGQLTCTVRANGTEIYCHQLDTVFNLGDESIVADDEYIYIYYEGADAYAVKCIDNTKTEYAAIKTGINGKRTNIIASNAFANCVNLKSFTIPYFIQYVAGAFVGCTSLEEVIVENCKDTVVTDLGVDAEIKRKHVYANKYSYEIRINNEHRKYNICDVCGSTIYSDYVVEQCEFDDNGVCVKCGNGGAGLYAQSGNAIILHSWDRLIKDKKITVVDGNITDSKELGSGKLIIPNSVIGIDYRAFEGCAMDSIVIPNSVTKIGVASFTGCNNLTSIAYAGTIAQWGAISKYDDWNTDVPATYVQCSDGQVSLV